MFRFLVVILIQFSVLKSEIQKKCDCPRYQINPTLSSTCGGSKFMEYIDLYIQSQCDIEDPCGRPTPRFIESPESAYDFIVVGSGSAGSVVASRLSENPEWSVLLIEAGEDEPTGTQVVGIGSNFQKTSIDWNYQAFTNNYSDRQIAWPRGKVLGGTSVLNAMNYMRGTKEDYDDWEALGNIGWNYNNVLTFFKKSEDNVNYENHYHSKGGLQSVGKMPYTNPMIQDILKAGVENGLKIHDLNAGNSTGIMIVQFTQKNGVRRSTSRSFLRPARDRVNLHILVNTTVTKLLLENRVVKGVQACRNNGDSFKIQTKKEVIVSAGVVGSPQLLLLSGIGPSKDLAEVGVKCNIDLSGVGKNLQDHVSYVVNFVTNQTNTNTLDSIALKEYMLNRNGPLSSSDIAVAAARIGSPYSQGRADLQFQVNNPALSCSKTGIPGQLVSGGGKLFKVNTGLMLVKSRGFIKLISPDPFKYPKIVGNYLENPMDLKILLYGVKFAVAFGKSKALEKYNVTLNQRVAEGCELFEYGSDEFWNCSIKADFRGGQHQTGTCKMGPSSDHLAVVDSRLKIHGLTGLRVVDASIMPNVIAGNTHATVMMIGEMGSNFIKEDYN